MSIVLVVEQPCLDVLLKLCCPLFFSPAKQIYQLELQVNPSGHDMAEAPLKSFGKIAFRGLRTTLTSELPHLYQNSVGCEPRMIAPHNFPLAVPEWALGGGILVRRHHSRGRTLVGGIDEADNTTASRSY